MKKHLWVLGLIFLLVVGCKLGSATARDSVDDNANRDNTKRAEPIPGTGTLPETVPTPAAPVQKADAVCPDPARPCHHKEKRFDDWELSFRMPAKMKTNKMYSSAPFYALILKTYDMAGECDGGEYIESIEAERKQLQTSEPARKAFASYECPNMGAVVYDFDGKWDAKRESALVGNFLAVYAGETKDDADRLLKKLGSKYPEAMVKKMTAGYEIIEQ